MPVSSKDACVSWAKKICRPVELRPPQTTTCWEESFSIKNEVADMKFICLGFHDETNWAQMSESEHKSFVEG